MAEIHGGVLYLQHASDSGLCSVSDGVLNWSLKGNGTTLYILTCLQAGGRR